MKFDKAKIICEAYHNGRAVTQISKTFGYDRNSVIGYLERYFERYYGEPYKPFSEKRAEFLEELYKKYQGVYIKGLYSRRTLCEMLNCTPLELEAMFKKYNIKNQWLQTYKDQRTLCNVPKEFYNSLEEFVKKYGYKSIREVTMLAVNEFMLQQELREKEDSE